MKKTPHSIRALCVLYLLTALGWFLYSYTQVDLSLTLSRFGLVRSLETSFQYVGYYERPLSTALFLGLAALLLIGYVWVLVRARKNAIGAGSVLKLSLLLAGILVFSYPAFSYDIFNYMFTAKTVLVYHQNPYTVIPLDFTGIEPWLSFMRWTHLPSAYTPLWIVLTLPAYILGFGYFLLILWNIKAIIALSYLIGAYLIGRILRRLEPGSEAAGVALFALNPLVIVETLVSPHNDMVMMAIVLFAVYAGIRMRFWKSLLVWAFSVAMKLMTLALAPALLFRWNRTLALLLMTAGLVAVGLTREILPWYFLWIAPFVALLPRQKAVTAVAGAYALGLLLRYAPVLYFGDYNAPVPQYRDLLTVIPVLVTVSVLLVRRFARRFRTGV
ncbi:hypothetical protein M1555_00565 [Patescibacteria group bacterium]|nr:hypothetical protein [Patescibacteria group bacterium]